MSNSIPLMDYKGEEVAMAEYHDPFQVKQKLRRSGKFQIPYELLFWIFFLGITLWAVVDRFTTNLYPMAIKFLPLQVSILSKNPTASIHSSVWVFDIYGRITGRMFLTVFNALFWTQCKVRRAAGRGGAERTR